MKNEYLVDEFIDDGYECTLAEQVDKKVSLLYDLCALCRRGRYADKRENAIRELLASYPSRTLMDNAMHDIVVGKCTVDQMLKRKGYLQ
jgi:hypothetical protein